MTSSTWLIPLTGLVLLLTAAPDMHAGNKTAAQPGVPWDSAVNNLLATGMYGFDNQSLPGLTLQLQHADNLYRGLAPGQAKLNGQAITFSYEGSSGLLGFSAGYILTNQKNSSQPGAVFMGLTPEQDKRFDPANSWYMALDLSKTYQVDEAISFNLGNKTMLLKNPFDTEEGKLFSVLFNMPISYKNYLTITPELQWSRPLSAEGSSSAYSSSDGKSPQDVFYGGVSISFSY